MAARLTIQLSQVSQSITGNYSTVTASVYYYGNGGSYNYENPPGSLTVNGVTYPFNHNFEKSTSAQLLYSVTVTVPHNADGTKTVTASANFVTGVSIGTLTASASLTLTTIPRASGITATPSTLDLGEDVTFNITPAVSTFTHTIQAGVNGTHPFETLTSGLTGSAPTFTWRVPKTWAAYMPQGQQIIVRCITYSGSTQIGFKDIFITANATPEMAPTASLAITDPEGYYDEYGGFVKGWSKIRAVATDTFYEGTTAKSRALTVNGVTYNAATAETPDPITTIPQSVEYTVVDGRGLSYTTSQAVPCYDWWTPSIVSVAFNRSDQDGTLNEEGNYIRVDYSVNIAPIGNSNGKNLEVKYKQHSATTWNTKTVTLSAYEVTGFTTVPASADFTYDVGIELWDHFTQSSHSTAYDNIGTAYTLVDYHTSGRGIAFGKVAENADLMDSDLAAQFRQGLRIGSDEDANLLILGNFSDAAVAEWADETGETTPSLEGILAKLKANYVIEENDSGAWHYRKWSNGKVELWGKFTQSVASYTAGGFVIGSQAVTGYPFAIANPIAQATCQKVGTGGGFITFDYERTDYWSGIANTIGQYTGTYSITWYVYVIADLATSNRLLSAKSSNLIELPTGELYDTTKGEVVKK